jgi:hypothetical protein
MDIDEIYKLFKSIQLLSKYRQQPTAGTSASALAESDDESTDGINF